MWSQLLLWCSRNDIFYSCTLMHIKNIPHLNSGKSWIYDECHIPDLYDWILTFHYSEWPRKRFEMIEKKKYVFLFLNFSFNICFHIFCGALATFDFLFDFFSRNYPEFKFELALVKKKSFCLIICPYTDRLGCLSPDLLSCRQFNRFWNSK